MRLYVLEDMIYFKNQLFWSVSCSLGVYAVDTITICNSTVLSVWFLWSDDESRCFFS